MSSYSLDAYLSLFHIGNKLDHDYIDLQRRLNTPRSIITDLIDYCLYDTMCLFQLDEVTSCIAKIVSIQTLLQLPLSFAAYQTDANCLTLFLQREYTAHGYTVCYQQADLDGYVKFKGAYTDRVAQENTVYKDVIMPDFTSLYPNSIRSMNACLTTINNNQLGRRIDLSDDDSLDVDHCHYEQTGGIMPEIITKMFDERKRTQALMKQQKKDSDEYNRLNALQLAIKICLNTLYGLIGNNKSPLFYKVMAASVTAFARQSIICARDVLINRGHTFLFADTDSAFVQLGQHVTDYKSLMNEMSIVNTAVQTQMNSRYLTLEIEEVVKAISFINGRKSYYCLNYITDHFRNWVRGNDHEQTDLKIRGISWSKMHDKLRQITTDTLKGFLTSGVDNVTYFKKVLDSIKGMINTALQTQDISLLSQFTERVKLTSDKSNLVAHLKQSYETILEGQSYTNVIVLKGKSLKTFRKIPL